MDFDMILRLWPFKIGIPFTALVLLLELYTVALEEIMNFDFWLLVLTSTLITDLLDFCQILQGK